MAYAFMAGFVATSATSTCAPFGATEAVKGASEIHFVRVMRGS